MSSLSEKGLAIVLRTRKEDDVLSTGRADLGGRDVRPPPLFISELRSHVDHGVELRDRDPLETGDEVLHGIKNHLSFATRIQKNLIEPMIVPCLPTDLTTTALEVSPGVVVCGSR